MIRGCLVRLRSSPCYRAWPDRMLLSTSAWWSPPSSIRAPWPVIIQSPPCSRSDPRSCQPWTQSSQYCRACPGGRPPMPAVWSPPCRICAPWLVIRQSPPCSRSDPRSCQPWTQSSQCCRACPGGRPPMPAVWSPPCGICAPWLVIRQSPPCSFTGRGRRWCRPPGMQSGPCRRAWPGRIPPPMPV